MKPLQIGDLQVPVPIVQGGMGIGISLSGLASAVAKAGGIGTIAAVGIGLLQGTPEKSFKVNNNEGISREIQRARKLTNGILGVNIMSVLTNFNDLVETAIREKIDIIFSGAGLPLDLPGFKTPGSRTKLVPIVSSARAAKIIASKWIQKYNYLPDAFVVEGPEAGGHLGFSLDDLTSRKHDLETLAEDVLKVTGEIASVHGHVIPVIAGGGIMNGKQIWKLLNMGVSGVQLGSTFIATRECDASLAFKEAIVSATRGRIKLINSPVGLPGRALESDFLLAAERGEKKPAACKYNCIKSCNPKTTKYCIADALVSAFRGNIDAGFVFSGARAYAIKSITSVNEVFSRLTAEYYKEQQLNLV